MITNGAARLAAGSLWLVFCLGSIAYWIGSCYVASATSRAAYLVRHAGERTGRAAVADGGGRGAGGADDGRTAPVADSQADEVTGTCGTDLPGPAGSRGKRKRKS